MPVGQEKTSIHVLLNVVGKTNKHDKFLFFKNKYLVVTRELSVTLYHV